MTKAHNHTSGGTCPPVPNMVRLKYFYGRMLGAQDLETEQNYFREKMKLHNRCLHGYGVICGLEVEPLPEEPESYKQPQTQKQEDKRLHHRLVTRCGVGLDCEGNELVVRTDSVLELRRALTREQWKELEKEPRDLYITICHCEQSTDPMRPVLPEACGAPKDCAYGKVMESVRIEVSLDPPKEDERCEPCCSECADPCLLLARIEKFDPTKPIVEQQVHNEVRRDISLYVPTRITGISWTHGASYTDAELSRMLGRGNPDGGLEIRFSRKIRTSTLQKGVIDTWVMEGGSGRRGNIYNLEGEIHHEDGEWTEWVRYQQTSKETLQENDRLLIILRSAFVLDPCCRPLDGLNVGGNVPLIEKYREFGREPISKDCAEPPGGFVWTSGNNLPGASFESWFFVGDKQGGTK